MLVTLDRIEKDIEKILRKMEPSVPKRYIEESIRHLDCRREAEYNGAREALEDLLGRCE